MVVKLRQINSGGQTGADRAALDAALALGVPIGGWVPRGRWAEDGSIPERYVGLHETAEEDVSVRTRLNVRDADATLIIFHGELHGGTLLTLQVAKELKKPHFLKDLLAGEQHEDIIQWLRVVAPSILNVAGARQSEDSEIYAATFRLMTSVIKELNRAYH